MPAPVELKGRPASPGLAIGPLVWLDASQRRRVPTGTPEGERVAFLAAVEAAIADLQHLMQESSPEAAEILEFQTAMLADDELSAPALAAIGAGAPADEAWRRALDQQILSYEAAEDEYFRARAADLRDIRDRVLAQLTGAATTLQVAGGILIGDDISPTRFLETDWSAGGGIALRSGSAASHVAMLARSRSIPMVVGIGAAAANGHAEAVVDGGSGAVLLSPDPEARRRAEQRGKALADAASAAQAYLRQDACTRDGTRIQILVNIARPEEVEGLEPEICDGIGLMRTEFLFGQGLPDEDSQLRAYRTVLDWAAGRPVTIRSADAGGDKPVPGYTLDEPNPFLGSRGIRLSLRRPDVFRIQLRALARAAVGSDLRIMLPMVTVPGEIAEAAAHLDAAMAELAAEGVPAARPPLGIMVEVPAVAITPGRFAAAAFFSIGSNDLTQYVTAAARDSADVAGFNDPADPAVMALIEQVARFGAGSGVPVSICGDAAGDPALVPLLLRAGLRSLSVAPAAVAAVKAAVAGVDLRAAR